MGYTQTFYAYDGSTAGAGKDPTTSYTASSGDGVQFAAEGYDTLVLSFELVSGTAPTSIEYLVEASLDSIETATGSSVWAHVPAVVESAGAYSSVETVSQITWALSASGLTAHSQTWEGLQARKLRIRCKRTGGAADTRIRVRAMLGAS